MKTYTDLEQSRILSKILPHESADMWYSIVDNEAFICLEHHNEYEQIPCWSLAALLGIIKKYGLIDLRFLSSTFDSRGEHLMNVWCCTFDNINTVSFDFYADNPIDVCYETILKLHELKIL